MDKINWERGGSTGNGSEEEDLAAIVGLFTWTLSLNSMGKPGLPPMSAIPAAELAQRFSTDLWGGSGEELG